MRYYFQCPRCKSDDLFYSVEEQRRDDSGTGCLMLLLGGILPYLLWSSSVRSYEGPRVQCGSCGYVFTQPPLPRSDAARLAFWVQVLVVLYGAVSVFSFAFWLFVLRERSPLPAPGGFEGALIAFFANNARAVVAVTVVFAVLLFLVAVGFSVSSNRKHRAWLKSAYLIEPFSRGQDVYVGEGSADKGVHGDGESS
jgi:hypothetical protein